MSDSRVLVTGASGVFGREITGRLVRAGHEVVTLSRRRPAGLPAGVEHFAADIRDADAVARGAEGCDVVAHCAWVVDALPGQEAEVISVNLDGTANVLAAMEKTGARRIVFASSMTAYGPRPAGYGAVNEEEPLRPDPAHIYASNKRDAEQMIGEAPVEGVTIRSAIVFGRSIDNRIFRALAAPVLVAVRGHDSLWQVVHADDVGRLFVRACAGDGPPGPVNLAAAGVVPAAELARILGRPLVTIAERPLRKVVQGLWGRGWIDIEPAELDIMLMAPLMDTTRLERDWGFECAWNAGEAAEDTRLAVMAVRSAGTRVLPLPWRVPLPRDVPTGHEPPADGAPLECAAADPAQGGEFDNPIDPRFPVFTQTNLSEACPGPSTPLTLDLCARGLSNAGAAAAELIGLSGVVGAEARARIQSIFGHRLYASVSCGYVLADATPGWDAEGITEQYLGRHAEEFHVGAPDVPVEEPRTVWQKVKAGAGLAVRGAGLVVGLSRDVDELVSQTARLEALCADLPALSDHRLEALAWLARDLVAYGWTVSGRAAVIAGGATTALARLVGEDTQAHLLGQGSTLPSASTLLGVRALADEARPDSALVAALSAGETDVVERVETGWPWFWASVQSALERFGHRGPGECELAVRTFSDDPRLLLRTVGKALASPPPAAPPAARLPRKARPLARMTARLVAERERGRDRTVRLVWLMRRIARDQGRRLVERGSLSAPDDAFYLITAELFAPPADAGAIVARRRRERERLAALTMPVAFSGRWHAGTPGGELGPGERLQGVGVSPGKVTAPVRVVDAEHVYDLEPGEVLVAHVTDVGYTAIFGHAAAVVTDIGGAMSHAAVVAREFGIPCVVDTVEASGRLRSGMLVEVDGRAGTVTVVKASPDGSPAP